MQTYVEISYENLKNAKMIVKTVIKLIIYSIKSSN